jgi:hypothetical protein
LAAAVTFGDLDSDDAFDTAPPDAVQVARRLQEYRQTVEDPPPPSWHDLTDDQRAVAVEVMRRLLAWGRRQGWNQWAAAT